LDASIRRREHEARKVWARYGKEDGKVNALLFVDRPTSLISEELIGGGAISYRLHCGRSVVIAADSDGERYVIDGIEYSLASGNVFLIGITEEKTDVRQFTVTFADDTPENIVDALTSEDVRVREFVNTVDGQSGKLGTDRAPG